MSLKSAHFTLSPVTPEENIKGLLDLSPLSEERQVCDVTINSDLPFSFQGKDAITSSSRAIFSLLHFFAQL